MSNFVGIEFKTTDGTWAKTMIDEEKADAVIGRLKLLTEVNVLENTRV
jgi:hypothetical protein